MCRSPQASLMTPFVGFIAAIVLVSASLPGRAGPTASPVLDDGERESLRRYARDTWHSFEAMAEPGELPSDGLRRDDRGAWKPTEKTTPTDIGAYLWSTVAAEKLGIIGPDEAARRLGRTLASLSRVKRVHGLFLDRLDPRDGTPREISTPEGKPIRPLLSAAGNGWPAAAFLLIGHAKPAPRQPAR